MDLSLNLSLVTKENLADIAEKIGLMHDLGKASNFFQEYIRGGSKSNSQHSSVSAIIAYINFKNWKEYSFFAPQAYKCIQKHHSDL
ncbi:MAG: CRISPR-associated endonuclease Cas3'', partial [Candidatus Cloacimonadaceae bacterium]